MSDLPILFSGPMVHALLAGTKTQTRRVIETTSKPMAPGQIIMMTGPQFGRKAYRFAPRVTEGDRLWVRETWAVGRIYDGTPPRDINPEGKPNWCGIRYAATDARHGIKDRVSIHMPRWASRLTLIVTAVKVERLQDISEEDARAEGIVEDDGSEPGIFYLPGSSLISGVNARKGALPIGQHTDPRLVYRDLLNNLHGSDLWRENPWVAAYTFTVHRQNIDAMEPQP